MCTFEWISDNVDFALGLVRRGGGAGPPQPVSRDSVAPLKANAGTQDSRLSFLPLPLLIASPPRISKYTHSGCESAIKTKTDVPGPLIIPRP